MLAIARTAAIFKEEQSNESEQNFLISRLFQLRVDDGDAAGLRAHVRPSV